MTEAEWLDSTDVPTLLAFVAGQDAPRGAALPVVAMSARKLRLYLVGCCRRAWERFIEPAASNAVVVAERFADGLADDAELAAVAEAARAEQSDWMTRALAIQHPPERLNALAILLLAVAGATVCQPDAELVRCHRYYGRSRNFVPIHPSARHIQGDSVVRKVAEVMDNPLLTGEPQRSTEKAAQAVLLRCVASDPFRSLPDLSLSARQDVTVRRLALGIYEDRAWDRAPILADALEDTGAVAGSILEHLRGPGPHARGCWVVDVILGKC
jgi:hypothetical protein